MCSLNKKCFFSVFLSMILVSCSSLKQPQKIYEPLDYTEKDAVDAEINRIREMKEEKPVQAMWRSFLIPSDSLRSDILKETSDFVYEKFSLALSQKDYYNAVKYYKSLKALGYSFKEEESSLEKKLLDLYLKDVPGLRVNKKYLPKTISDCLNATVTVWVDKGIKIERGSGFADIVIGSGFFIDERGYIVTNHHVISDVVDPKNEKFSKLYIKLMRDSETRIPCKVVGYDAILDIALLKAEVEPPFILELGSSKDLNLGDKISAIGTPLGLQGTVTSGIVSSIDRKLFTMGSVFQIDAAVNSGNSGGPCIDSLMKVQAIVFAGIMQYQGLNFAIPVEYLRQDLPFLYHGGKRKHAWTSAYGHTKKEGLESTGLEVQYVMPGGSSSRSGLKKGDVITFVDGKRILSIEEIQGVFRNYDFETVLEIKYIRNNQSFTGFIYLEERPSNPGYEIYKSDLLCYTFIPLFGMELVPSSSISKRTYSVIDVIKGSVSDEYGFSVTDPIYVNSVDFSPDDDAVSVSINTRRKKKGYLDITMNLVTALDNPYYF